MRRAVDSPTLVVLRAPGGVDAPPASALRVQPGVREAAVLATCHRTELYLVVDDQLWRRGFSLAITSPAITGTAITTGTEAARHLFRVACGLDSPILVDGQVLGQVRRAYLAARQAGTTGPILNRLFETALCAGKRTRHGTALGRGATTTASAAAGLAERLAAGVAGRHVLIIGAGETAALAARHLARRHPAAIVIANRSPGRAEALAREVGGSAIGLDALRPALAAADIVVSATSRPGCVITADLLAQATAGRASRPMIAIDLAAPHDIEPACGAIPGVVLRDLSAVERGAETDRAARAAAIPSVEAIVEDHLARFDAWRAGARAADGIRPVRASTRVHRHAGSLTRHGALPAGAAVLP
jgi:glutamyl-tRNA reductase